MAKLARLRSALLHRLLQQSKLPPTLFHYTNAHGLLGIITDRFIRATSVHYLNDSTEFDYGVKLIRRELKKRCQESTCAKERGALHEISTDIPYFPGVCVASLTGDGDLLSQWRSYAGGSGGFAIGFRPKCLRELAREDQRFYLAKCLYSPKDQLKAIKALIDEFCRHIAALQQFTSFEAGGSRAEVVRLATLLKHESFQEEREWRLLSTPQMVNSLEYRAGVSTIIPYCKFDLRASMPVLSR